MTANLSTAFCVILSEAKNLAQRALSARSFAEYRSG